MAEPTNATSPADLAEGATVQALAKEAAGGKGAAATSPAGEKRRWSRAERLDLAVVGAAVALLGLGVLALALAFLRDRG